MLLAHSRFRRIRFHRVQGTNSPLDPRLEAYWEERRTRAPLYRVQADRRALRRYLLRRQDYRCAVTGLPLEDLSEVEVHHGAPREVGGNDRFLGGAYRGVGPHPTRGQPTTP
jgi:hypothetical protein